MWHLGIVPLFEQDYFIKLDNHPNQMKIPTVSSFFRPYKLRKRKQ